MRQFLKETVIFFSMFIGSLTSFGQTGNDHQNNNSSAGYRSDFTLLKDTMEKVHPALYRYTAKKRIDYIFDSCFQAIKDSTSLTDFILLTKFAIASIGDGHANSKLSSESINEYLGNTKVFPAMLLFIHGAAYIFCCKQHPSLDGTQLLSINGRLMTEIVPKLFSYVSTDGTIESRKNWELPGDFHWLFNSVYGCSDKFSIICKTSGNLNEVVTLTADTMKNFECKSPFRRPDKYLTLRYTSHHTAVLTLQTFFDGFLDQTGEHFKPFLDSAFADIRNKRVKRLLIDVRSNQGGNDGNGALLYSYLSKSPFQYYTSLETVHEKFTEAGHSLLGLQQPQAHYFDGEVFILMNGRSFSGVAEFAAIARSNDRAKFIGEECGGGYYGNSSGDEAMVMLPHSKITARIPLIRYTMAVKNIPSDDGGMIPDFPNELSIADVISGNDGQMAYALRVVDERR